jgi:hypothetical protein
MTGEGAEGTMGIKKEAGKTCVFVGILVVSDYLE